MADQTAAWSIAPFFSPAIRASNNPIDRLDERLAGIGELRADDMAGSPFGPVLHEPPLTAVAADTAEGV